MPVLLRATRKVLRHLPAPSAAAESVADTALGDWYVNRVVIDRVPILIAISSHSVLPLLLRAKDTRTLPERLPDLVRARLRRLGVPSAQVEAEVRAMDPVSVAKTANRSVVGILVEFGMLLSHWLPNPWVDGDLIDTEARLAEVPCFVGRHPRATIFPADHTRRLLSKRWGPSEDTEA
jgi:hypothetical protein